MKTNTPTELSMTCWNALGGIAIGTAIGTVTIWEPTVSFSFLA